MINNSKPWWNSPSEEELKSIEQGLKDFESGRTHKHEEVRKRYEKYL